MDCADEEGSRCSFHTKSLFMYYYQEQFPSNAFPSQTPMSQTGPEYKTHFSFLFFFFPP